MTPFDPKRTHRRQADSGMAEALRKLRKQWREVRTMENPAHKVLDALHRQWKEKAQALKKVEPTPNRRLSWWHRLCRRAVSNV